MQGLRTAENGSCGLQSHADNVVVRLLRRQHGTSSLGMHAQHPGTRIRGAKALFHDFSPNAAGSAEFRNFFQHVVMSIPEEGQTSSEIINIQAGFNSRIDIGNAVGDGESDFLGSSRASFTNVIAGNRDGVPQGNVFRAIFENIGNQTHGRLRRENVSTASRILFQNIILDGAAQFVSADALFLANGDVHGQKYRSRRVDGHGSGYFAQINLIKEDFHVGQRVDSHAHLAYFAFSHIVVRIVTDLSRQVKCARQAGAARFEQVTVTLVGFFRRGEAGIHTHGPETATVHGRLYATGEGIGSWESDIVDIVGSFDIQRSVETIVGQVTAFRIFRNSLFHFGCIGCQFFFQNFIAH